MPVKYSMVDSIKFTLVFFAGFVGIYVVMNLLAHSIIRHTIIYLLDKVWARIEKKQ